MLPFKVHAGQEEPQGPGPSWFLAMNRKIGHVQSSLQQTSFYSNTSCYKEYNYTLMAYDAFLIEDTDLFE